jgi:pimeloyl-ACP methyl ester carboxylesterase
MGSSMGTATLIYAALAQPERFRRLVLTSAPTAWQTRAAQAQLYGSIADIVEQGGIQAFLDTLPEQPIAEPFDEMANTAVAPEVEEALLPTVLRGAALTDLPPVDELRELNIPVLLLPWANDPGHPVITSEALLDALPDARLQLGTTAAELRGWGRDAAAFLAA